MKKTAFLLVAGALCNVPAHAQTMPASIFLAKAEALGQRGALALFSSDFRLLKSEADGSFKALEEEVAAARKSGRTPEYCEPPKATLNSAEITAYLRTIPAEQRGMPIMQALRGLLKKKFPC